ncbi:phage tail protein [Xenorhabdus japonica]|uniref:Phage Tail Collar Domain n=1 Tax=Xenorhabdus japonica TaxID=53341 RepID=A0A1I5B688_9GAMM|nr:phage tail protein [Xenorhabdus japonica]SFN70212.1 Phage Tail Collar Domain [Xenorhabdus japonica]
MSSVITADFEKWKAQQTAAGTTVILDEFVFANVPNLDPSKEISRSEKLPAANQIVHRQAVNKTGLASENAVAYSVTLGTEVGNFDFNWIGLINKASGVIGMITHAPTQKKIKTANGLQGNVLTRSFLLEFDGAATETAITTTAETWQIDFTARLTGIDEMQRLINTDSYGEAAFFNDGFAVIRSGDKYTVKKGLAYVGGLRGVLAFDQTLNSLRNTRVYADFSYQGNLVSQWKTGVKITATNDLKNYVDVAGYPHYVFAIARIDGNGNVTDLRHQGTLSDRDIAELNRELERVKQDCAAKQQALENSVNGKQPQGNYATNIALNAVNENAVPKSRSINGKSLSADVVLGAVDVGAFPKGAAAVVEGDDAVPWDAASGAYVAKQPGGTLLVVHFNVSQGSTPALQLKTQYRNGSIAYRSARDSFGFEEPWTEFYTTKNKPTAFDVDAVSASRGGTFHDHVRFDKRVIVGSNDTSPMVLSSEKSAASPVNIHIWGNAARGGDRHTVLEAGDNQGWFWYSHRLGNGGVQFSVNGSMLPEDYSNFDNRYLQHHQHNIPVGVPLPWPNANPPAGYVECKGQHFDPVKCPKLAEAYPSCYLPDLRGEFIRGLDNGRGIDSGRGALSWQNQQVQYHSHLGGHGGRAGGNFGITTQWKYAGSFHDDSKQPLPMTNNGSDFDGFTNNGAIGTETRPRNIAFLYIVREA